MEKILFDDEFGDNFENQLKSRASCSHDEMYNYGRINLVDVMLSVEKDNIILDIGCGDGSTLQRHHYAHYLVGIDISEEYSRDAKKNVTNGEILLASMDNLPFKEKTFDRIVAVYSFIYIPNKEKTLFEISRILKDNGIFVVYDPNKLSLRTLVRKLSIMKLWLSGNINNPRYILFTIMTKQALSYWNFKKIGKNAHLEIDNWCGVFSYHLITSEKVTSFLFDRLYYKKWGFIPWIKIFSDFLIIKFVKKSISE